MVISSHLVLCFFFSSRRRHTRYWRDWSSDVCSSDLGKEMNDAGPTLTPEQESFIEQVGADPASALSSQAPGRVFVRSEERRVGKSVDLGGRPMIKKKT